jgi:hypothetical protein
VGVAEGEAFVLTSTPKRALAGALREDRGELFFTTSVENREAPPYIGHYPVHVQVHPYEKHEDAL